MVRSKGVVLCALIKTEKFQVNAVETKTRRCDKPSGGTWLWEPRNQHEETFLLLLIADALAVRMRFFGRVPEARMHSLGNATVMYDLATQVTVR
ncbi:hypothetical protein pipiens_018348 [Culex pipiens pipiens]